jgi:hypothetical protein
MQQIACGGFIEPIHLRFDKRFATLLQHAAAPVPDPGTILRWLKEAVAEGTVRGDGATKSPFRYWLPAMEEKRNDILDKPSGESARLELTHLDLLMVLVL